MKYGKCQKIVYLIVSICPYCEYENEDETTIIAELLPEEKIICDDCDKEYLIRTADAY